MLMVAESPTKDYFMQRMTRDPGMSPSFRPRHCTPPRLVPASSDPSSYDSPMLTPSPLRQPPLFPSSFNPHLDDLFLQSPYKSPALHSRSLGLSKPHPIVPDDDDGSIFLSSPSTGTSFSPFFPPSSSQPLRTPIKQILRMSSRSALPPARFRSPPLPDHSLAPPDPPSPATRLGIGIKRKSTPHLVSTPVRPHNLTPIDISSATLHSASLKNSATLDRLAPLPAPRFIPATPRTKAETDAYLRRQTTTLTRLSITDPNNSLENFSTLDDDSGCEMDDDDHHRRGALFNAAQSKYNHSALKKSSGHEYLDANGKGREKEEVAEAISPGGHIIKRRARRRPLSAELLESVRQSPSPTKYVSSKTNARPRHSGIAFPSAAHSRKRTSSSSSDSDSASPLPRRRLSNTHPHPPKPILQPTRVNMSRQDNMSAASLFFGPSIVSAPSQPPLMRSRTSTPSLSSAPALAPFAGSVPPKITNRHSYAGPSGTRNDIQAWNTIQRKAVSASPQSSPPCGTRPRKPDTDEEEEMFFGAGAPESSFMFSVTEDTPPPRLKRSDPATLPRKYKPRDSGVVMMSDDDDDDSMCISGEYLCVLPPMPPASTSVGSLQSDMDDNLVTPSSEPDSSSGWPSILVRGSDNVGSEERLDVDAFIMRALAAASKGPHDAKKKVPGTPVKRLKTQYLASGARPWQSAVASKVGVRFDWDAKKGKVPRQSLPAAFPAFGKKAGKLPSDQDTDSELEESPGQGRAKYVGLGWGRPPAATRQDELKSRTRWLMRRSSSGAFSSGSESISSSGTPTRLKSKDWHPTAPLVSAQFSSSTNALKLTPGRSTSGSSSSSNATINSPSVPSSRRLPIGCTPRPSTERMFKSCSHGQPGRFEREFLAEDEVGSGEFGKVIKVHRKNSNDSEVYAVKRSKRFEGPRHRLRLREEVEILQHLSHIASHAEYERNRHPNVLAYIDSWEEDETLYIQTELCESGNLAQFLWEFGRAYPRLDEDRVWKIVVDLSNGLRFIHEAGVIHLDLKPSNVFVTVHGRFKIGDFGMASLWPRPIHVDAASGGGGFEREGDKLYLAPEVLQGKYSKAADMFSFGMTILETASNIVVPDQGEAWHRLRQEDFSQVDLDGSPELLEMIKQMMRTEPSLRMSVHAIYKHPVVSRARVIMEGMYIAAKRNGTCLFAASPLGSVHRGFLEEILGRCRIDNGAMDVCI